MTISEFDLIQRYFADSAQAAQKPGVVLGIGDDCAILRPAIGRELVVAVDTLVAGVHFPQRITPRQLGGRSLAVNLSDLAAMGSEPAWFTLALTLPAVDEAWLQAFSEGLFEMAEQYRIALIGGDTTRGPLTVSVQVIGQVATGAALRRDGARVGDQIYVSGQLGDAGGGLVLLQAGKGVDGHSLVDKLLMPQPRVRLGRALVGLATAAIDISDGLLADLGHILTRSGVGAKLNVASLPLSEPLLSCFGIEKARQLALTAGDDYELCFCVPPGHAELVAQIAKDTGLCLTRVGEITAAPGLQVLDEKGQPVTLSASGYQHFSEDPGAGQINE